MDELSKYNREQVVDLLAERLVFERAGVQLYDRVCAAIDASKDANVQRLSGEMHEHRDDEKEHEEFLEAQIRKLGADPSVPTERSRLVTRESKGILEVVMSDAELPHLLHALLAAELVDNAGWDLLVELADDAGDREAKKEFKKRLHKEEEHLVFVRKAVQQFARADVLGEERRMPKTDLGASLP